MGQDSNVIGYIYSTATLIAFAHSSLKSLLQF